VHETVRVTRPVVFIELIRDDGRVDLGPFEAVEITPYGVTSLPDRIQVLRYDYAGRLVLCRGAKLPTPRDGRRFRQPIMFDRFDDMKIIRTKVTTTESLKDL